jgi:hypothetical protein
MQFDLRATLSAIAMKDSWSPVSVPLFLPSSGISISLSQFFASSEEFVGGFGIQRGC